MSEMGQNRGGSCVMIWSLDFTLNSGESHQNFQLWVDGVRTIF